LIPNLSLKFGTDFAFVKALRVIVRNRQNKYAW
jgi:hypothetical protein